MMVGEVNLTETRLIAPYLGDDDELHLAFDFESLAVPWEAGAWRSRRRFHLAAQQCVDRRSAATRSGGSRCVAGARNSCGTVFGSGVARQSW